MCGRRICPACKRGFPDKPLAVCAECLAVLTERVEQQERAARRKAAIEQLLGVQREEIRVIEEGFLRDAPLARLFAQIAEARLVTRLRAIERGLNDDARRT